MARPSKYETHVKPRLSEVADWVRNGSSDKEVARRLGIAADSLIEYKKRFPEFSECLKNTRAYVDGQVENALLKRAIGYDVEEVAQEIYSDGSKHVKKIKRHIPPDITAMIFWLKNRRPEKWRDKPQEDNQQNAEVKIVIDRKVIDLSKGKNDGTD